MKNLILGAFSNYDYSQLQYWVNSIKRSGFEGDVVVVVGNATFATVEKLIQKGVKIIAFEKDDENHVFKYTSGLPIQTERFFHFWNFLKDHWQDYDNVITVDMKDVVFQTNPFDWLQEYMLSEIIVGSECLTYENEPWGRENLKQGFGQYFYDWFKGNTIYNVGVIGGESEYIKDLCLNIFQMSTNRPIPIVEQAAFNALIQTVPYWDIVHFTDMREGWVVHLGTVMDPTKIDQFRPHLLEPEPKIIDDDGLVVCTNEGERMCIVHQYDRVPKLKLSIENQYGD